MQTSVTTKNGLALLGGSLLLALSLITQAGKGLENISAIVFEVVPPHSQLAQVSGAGSGLVAHYSFDDNTNDSAGSNNGTASGGPTYVDGKMGKALQLDGVDEWVSVADSDPISISTMNGITMSAWVKATDFLSYPVIFEKTASYELRLTYLSASNKGKVDATVVFPDNTRCRSSTNSQVITEGGWYHIVAVATSTSVNAKSCPEIYINGVSQAVTTASVSTSFQDYNILGIGRRSNTASQFLNGSIDDARIYNRALSPSEIAQLYTETNISTGITVADTSTSQLPPPSSQTPTPTPNPAVNPNPTCPVSSGITEFYVSPQGSANNCGTISSPWDLATALQNNTISSSKNSAVKPGDTIWLRGGDYTGGSIRSYLQGAPGRYVTLRQYPRERARLLDMALFAEGPWVNYWGFEMAGTDTNRTSTQPGQTPTDVTVKYPFTFVASNVRAINLNIHDYIGLGISNFSASSDSEMYGNLVYYNGYVAPDRPHGPGIYSQNVTGSKSAVDNIVFSNFATGLQITGSTVSSVNNYSIVGNTLFNNGQIAGFKTYHNFYIAGGGAARNVSFNNNYVYNALPLASGANSIGPSNGELITGAYDLTFKDNYIADFVLFYNWQNMIVTGNTFIKILTSNIFKLITPSTVPAYTWDANTYYTSSSEGFQLADKGQGNGLNHVFTDWKSLTGFDAHSNSTNANPTQNAYFVRANKYESGRANITIFNWEHKNTVPVDISLVDVFDQNGNVLGRGSLLQAGDTYELHNTQNYFGDVITGTYTGGLLSINMLGHTVAPPVGVSTPASTFPEFGSFVLVRTASGGATPAPLLPPLPPQQTQPTIQPLVVPPTPTIVPQTPAPVTQPAPLTNPLNKTTNTVPPTTKQSSSITTSKTPTSSTTKTSPSSVTSHPDLPIPADLEPLPNFQELSVWQYLLYLLKSFNQMIVRGFVRVFSLITQADRNLSNLSTFIDTTIPLHSQLAQVSSSLSTGLVAHYTFDEGSGTTAADSSGSGNAGNLQGANGLPTWTAGKVGSGALMFDGVDDRVVVASPTNAAFTTTLTLSAWIKTTDTSGRIVARTDGLAYGYTLSIGDTASDGKARIWLDKDAGVGSFDAVRTSDSAVNDGSWHHIAGVYDGPSGRLDLYVDGVACATSIIGAVPASIVAQTRPLYVAADNSCSQSKYCLEGSVDDVRVYSRALSNNEIQDIYTYTAPTQSQPLATQDQPPVIDPIQVVVPSVTPPTIPPPPPGTTDWYVSPTGTSAGNGTIANPWDLQTALTDNTDSASKNFVVKSGHTIWLRGGVYTPPTGSTFNSALTGAAGNNISVRPYQGEHAIIQGGILQFKSGKVTGNVTYRDLEITGSETIFAKRISTQTSSFSFRLIYLAQKEYQSTKHLG